VSHTAHEQSLPCPLQPHGISIAHPAGLLSPLLRVTLEHLQVKALDLFVFVFHFLSSLREQYQPSVWEARKFLCFSL
jgi:hypothetical protein